VNEIVIHISESGISNTAAWERFVKEHKPGKYLLATKSFKKRSLPQNRYYHSVVVQIVFDGLRAAGFDSVRTKEDAHEVIKSLFLKIVDEKAGIKIERIKSTTELTTIEFNEYLLNISVWASDYLGCSIPEPGQAMVMFND
jgi:RNA-binding protein YhbY